MAKNNDKENLTLYEWFDEQHTEDDKRELFLYMDSAMKYVHELGLCVGVFNPKDIELLNSSTKYVKFDELYDIKDLDYNFQQKIINKDIFESSRFQILEYAKMNLNTPGDFIKEHFDEFTAFIPDKDAPYYRGVIERGASVYFIEYEAERLKREANDIEKELNGTAEVQDNNELEQMLSNNKVNRLIYGEDLSKAAFINILLYPTIIIVLVLVISYLVYLLKYFGF